MSAALSPLEASTAVDHLHRIRHLSRWMVRVSQALLVLTPIAWLWYWMNAPVPDLAMQANLPAGVIQLGLLPWQRVVAAAVNAVPLVCVLLGVRQVKQCFEDFAQGQVFTVQATTHLRRFAGWVAGAAFAAILAGAVVSVVLTLQNVPGTRHLAIGVSSEHVFTLFFAALVWLMADIIAQGQTLAEENERFV
jgi:hypothetical protein